MRHATNEPLFMAAVGHFSAPDEEPKDTDGFRIVTADAEGGMVDVHDRRLIVFTKEVAREWLSDIALVYARNLLDEQALPADEFVWYPVSQDVGNVRNDGPSLLLLRDHASEGRSAHSVCLAARHARIFRSIDCAGDRYLDVSLVPTSRAQDSDSSGRGDDS
ncbi:SOS response-associated peptidase family protein [Stutzerimonas sp. VN223-3]